MSRLDPRLAVLIILLLFLMAWAMRASNKAAYEQGWYEAITFTGAALSGLRPQLGEI